MDFIDEVRTRSGRFAKRLKDLQNSPVTEEATKTSFVLPFIQMLGYDIFSPAEVIPEFTADIGTKQGEKVDFAIFKDGAPAILIECKKLETNLGGDAVSQLLRYFGVTSARIGILTDGISYLFFSDLDQSNVMDPRPFFKFNMLDFTELQIAELKRFSKDSFDKSQIVDAARELKYTAEIKRLLAQELSKPSDDFVKYVIKQVYNGRMSIAVRKMFKDLTYSAFNQFISDKLQSRLESALKQEGEAVEEQRKEGKEQTSTPEVFPNELAGLNVIKAILGGFVDPNCLQLRKTKLNVSVVLHSTPEKKDFGTVVFRLWARPSSNFIKLEAKGIEPIKVDTIDDLFSHTDILQRFVAETFKTSEAVSKCKR